MKVQQQRFSHIAATFSHIESEITNNNTGTKKYNLSEEKPSFEKKFSPIKMVGNFSEFQKWDVHTEKERSNVFHIVVN